MGDFKRKKRLHHVLYSPAISVLLVVLLLLGVRAAWSAYGKSKEARTSLAETERQYESLGGRKDYLESETEYLATSRGKEEALRNRYSVARSGEALVIIVDGSSTASTSGEKGGGFWGRIWEFFR